MVLGVVEADAVGLGDGQGVLEALLIAVPLGVAEAVALGVTLAAALGVAVADGVALADGAWKQIDGCGVNKV